MKRRFKIFWKLVIALGLMTIIPVLVISYILATINVSALRTSAKEYYQAIADSLTTQIDTVFGEIEEDLTGIVSLLENEEFDFSQVIEMLSVKIEKSEYIDFLSFYSEEGSFLDAIAPENIEIKTGYEQPLSSEVMEKLKKDGQYRSGTFFAEGEPYPYIRFLKKWEREGQTFFVGTDVSLRFLSNLVERLSFRRFARRRDLVFMINSDSVIIAHADPKKLLKKEKLLGKGPLKNIKDRKTLTAYLSTPLGTTTEYNWEGERMLGTLLAYPEMKWGIVVQQPTKIAYASVAKMQLQVVIWATVSLGIALLIGALISKKITTPVVRLMLAAQQVAKGDFSQRVEVTSNDEIGALTETFNWMAQELDNYRKRIIEETRIRTNISRYLSPDVAKIIMETGDLSTLAGTKKFITVFFADINDFTPLTEQLGADQIAKLLNEFLSMGTEIVFRNGGTVDKFIGDCIMAIFGAPFEKGEPCESGVRAAIELMKEVKNKEREWLEKFGREITIGIGMASGVAVVGNLGSSERMEYTAVGDTVNTAARLEGLAGRYDLLIDANTYERVKDKINAQFLGSFEVKGKTQKVDVYKVIWGI